ncbi:MAG: YIP1 family protein [Archangium sp.]
MATSELAQDGSVIWSTLAQPAHGLASAVARRRVLSALVFSTLLSLLAAALILPVLDAEAVAGNALQGDLTPHERELAIENAIKLHHVATWAKAAFLPVVSALLITIAVFFAFWIAGARTTFKATFTVTAHALIPQALRALLLVAPARAHAPIDPDALATLLPSTLAAWLPKTLSLPGPAMAVASALDLFTLWSLFLLGSGMAKASKASTLRTSLVMFVLFASYLALFKVVPAASGGPH